MGHIFVLKLVDFQTNGIPLGASPTPTPTGETVILQPAGPQMTAYVNQSNQQLTEHSTQYGYYYQVNAGDFVEFWITNANSTAVWCRGGLFTNIPQIGDTAVQPALNGPDGEHVATGGYGSITPSETGYLYLCGFNAANFVVQATRIS